MAILRGIKFTTALAAFAMFFMPWLDVQCSNKSLLTQTGVQTITGKVTPSKEMKPRKGDGKKESLGSAGFVAGALLATALGIGCLLVALLNGQMKMDAAGSVLCALALLCLLFQLSQGFPIKEELITEISTDQATNEADMGSFLAKTMMNDLEVVILPGFTYTCVLLGVVVLLSMGLLLGSLGAARPGGVSLLLVMCLVGCEAEISASPETKGENLGQEPVLSGGDYLLQKLDAIVIPAAYFEGTTIEDALEFVRMRMAELDPEPDPHKKGISFVIRRSVEEAGVSDEGSDDLLVDDESLDKEGSLRISLSEENIKAADLLTLCAERAGLNFYLTSRGFLMCHENERLNPETEREQGVEIWKVFREAER